MLHMAFMHPRLSSSWPRCLDILRREIILSIFEHHTFSSEGDQMLVSFSPEKTPSRADFQWCLKVWILMQTDPFAYSHLGIGPLIFIYYSPWQHVQSVCRFPSSFNFQWLGRLLLVVLLSAWIKEKHWTGSLWDCSCSGKMCIHFTLVGCEQRLQANQIQLLIIFLLWGTFLLLFQASFLNQTTRWGND